MSFDPQGCAGLLQILISQYLFDREDKQQLEAYHPVSRKGEQATALSIGSELHCYYK